MPLVRVAECMPASGYCAVVGACVRVRVATECVGVRVAIVL